VSIKNLHTVWSICNLVVPSDKDLSVVIVYKAHRAIWTVLYATCNRHHIEVCLSFACFELALEAQVQVA